MSAFTESVVKEAALDWFRALGYTVVAGPDMAPEPGREARASYGEAIFSVVLYAALKRLNPGLPPEAIDDAFRKLTRPDAPTLTASNHIIHRMLVEGVSVEFRRPDGSIAGAQVQVLDFAQPENNDWLVVNQFTVVENQHHRRPDVVLSVNGLPLAVIELKNAADENATIWSAFNQLQTYKQEISSLFVYNEALVISDGLAARIGTFARCHELLRQQPVQAESRAELRKKLQVASGGVIFTTIQKFFPEEKGDRYPALSDRRNIVVIADEAHRSQYDFIDGFARHMRAALVKSGPDGHRTSEEVDHAIRQIVSGAIASGEVIDVFAAAGLKKPDISILSDEFLAEVRELPQRNLAVELLRKLLTGEIKTLSQKNVVQARSFADMLGNTIKRYQNRAIEAAQVIEELIALAKDMREADRRGEKLGLSDEELAFYDALEVNDSAVKVLGEPTLMDIARELVDAVRKNVTIDWTVKESVRAKLRVLVKRILRKYGYPPDKQERATQTVLEQAELLCSEWVMT